jgi:hypothetical protein
MQHRYIATHPYTHDAFHRIHTRARTTHKRIVTHVHTRAHTIHTHTHTHTHYYRIASSRTHTRASARTGEEDPPDDRGGTQAHRGTNCHAMRAHFAHWAR